MAERYLFFNSTTNDPRVYQAQDFADYFGSVLLTGLLYTDEIPAMNVSVEQGTMNTVVSTGKAIMQGHLYENTAPLRLTHSIQEPGADRIDRIILRLDKRNQSRFIRLFVKQGTPSDNPVPPSLQRDNNIYEISLAQVIIRGGQSFISPADIIDERGDEDICPWARSTVLPHIDAQDVIDLRNDFEEHKADGTQHAKTARIVIGTSTFGWKSKDCHYLCDGIDDQEEINAAIQALPVSGGEIIILDGIYNIYAEINVNKSNISIKGNGNATVLRRMWNSSSNEGVITLDGTYNCKIENLWITGNRSSLNNHGIYLSSSSYNNTITGNTCENNSRGIFLDGSRNNTVTDNTCNGNYDGIFLSYSNSNTMIGNTCNDNNDGIVLSSSDNNTVTGNVCNANNNSGIILYSISHNNTVTGNVCNNNNDGILISNSHNNTVTGNVCNNNNDGILISFSDNNTITGNTCIRGTGQSSDYASNQYTIRLTGSNNNYNLISSNNCMGKDVVIEGGTSNTSVNNKYD